MACSCEGGDGEENDEEGRQLCIEAGERVQEELAIGDILFCPGVRSEVCVFFCLSVCVFVFVRSRKKKNYLLCSWRSFIYSLFLFFFRLVCPLDN